MSSNKYWVPMVAKAIGLIEAISATDRELTLHEISRGEDISKTSAFRILFTLDKLGYIRRNQASGRYSVGFKMLDTLSKVTPATQLTRIGRPYLEKLRDDLDETVNLAVPWSGEIVYTAILESRHPFRMVATVGSTVPLHSTALGKCFAAFWPDGDAQEIIKRIGLKRFTPYTITNRKKFLQAIKKVQSRGYALDEEETELAASCVAVPALDEKNRAIGAISVSGPTPRIRAKQSQIIDALKKAAALISEELGHKPQRRPAQWRISNSG